MLFFLQPAGKESSAGLYDFDMSRDDSVTLYVKHGKGLLRGGNYFLIEPLNGTTRVDIITAKNVFCDSADLSVERLPEGFAFLKDSLRTKTEGGPPLAHGLLPELWLNALRPRPATTILRLTPLAGAPVQPACPECGCRRCTPLRVKPVC